PTSLSPAPSWAGSPASASARAWPVPPTGTAGLWPRRSQPGRGAGTVRSMLVAFSITPLGVGEDVGREVAEAVRVVRASGLPNRTDAMFTTTEGEWDEVMDV